MTKRAFASQAEFDAWHELARTAAGLPVVGVNAWTGQPAPGKQQTTDYASLQFVEVDVDGTVIDATLVATVGDARLVARGLTDGVVRAGLLTATELDELAAAYPDWVDGVRVEAGEIRAYGGELWQAAQEHDTSPGREPPNAPDAWEGLG